MLALVAEFKLGSDKAPVRLGGLYALERLAQDNPAHRQTIVNVICAYLCMPFSPTAPASKSEPGTTQALEVPAAEAEASTVALGDTEIGRWQQERQVRLTAQRILAEHLRDDRAQEQRSTEPPSQRFWPDIRLDLAGATLIDFIFDGGVTADARFDGATFSGAARFDRATFTFTDTTRFDGASFTGGAGFDGATFSGDAQFDGATFNGSAPFAGATFSGDARFAGATFIRSAWFDDATFSGSAWFDRATFGGSAGFEEATFDGAARFDGATFSDAGFDGAAFDLAVFSGATFNGDARFPSATLTDSWFRLATFNSGADFSGATFNGRARFEQATFNGRAGFERATFNGLAGFADATFSDRAYFAEATFSGKHGLVFKRSRVLSSDADHAWPAGWCLGPDGSGGYTVARGNDASRT
jgi:uncharacterized protein YjbI with pentapeptide repeats